MNVTQQGIITLLKSAVLQQPLALPADFDVEAAVQIIKRHHMAALAYEGAVLCGISRQHPQMQAMFRSCCKALQISVRQQQTLDCVFAAFEENGIDYMPLKGSCIKDIYPKPELRQMGDADILIRQEQYERIVPIVKSLGFVFRDISNHDFAWKSDTLYLELHHRLVPSYDRDFFEYYASGWHRAHRESGSRYAMNTEDTFVYLFAHFAKHFRDGGIGCRHVVDLWVYRRSFPDMDEEYIRSELQKLQIAVFYENILHLIAVWFDGACGDVKSDLITAYIFASGSWGEMDSRAISLGLRNSKQSGSAAGSRLRYVWGRLFPGISELKNQYPVLNKALWLLPAIWLIRLIRKLMLGKKLLIQQKQRLDMMSQENLETRKQMLRYVGLEYHC